MSHSFTKIWIHGIFSTKNREPIIRSNYEGRLYSHIATIIEQKFEGIVKAVNGDKEHIHILFLLSPNYSVQEVFHYIKGESSHWINQNDFLNNKFAWQIGYGAFSISESRIEEVKGYIDNQKEHHKKKSFSEEYTSFIEKYQLDKN